ncbi:MAG: Dabb family protein [Planctomyces sp.]
MLSHMVYLTLKDSSPDAIRHLVDDCNRFLKSIPGITFFAAGTLAPEYQRPVNDQNFHVALNVVFDSVKSHDAYQTAEAHQAFIAANRDNWAQVRIFDAHVA